MPAPVIVRNLEISAIVTAIIVSFCPPTPQKGGIKSCVLLIIIYILANCFLTLLEKGIKKNEIPVTKRIYNL
jgi:hypothetical protein